MATKAAPQTTIYETTIENEELEALLEDREKLRDRRSSVHALYKEADDKTRALIDTLDLGDDAPVRVGRFVITRRRIEGRSVSFDTGESQRLYIRQLEL